VDVEQCVVQWERVVADGLVPLGQAAVLGKVLVDPRGG
jgi:hypothetical protein